MIRSLYQAASAMMAQMSRQLTISNNLSNVSTPGYKEEIGALNDFREMLLRRFAGTDVRQVGPLSTGVALDEAGVNLSQGALAETGQPLDLAITGDAFFAIQTPDGVQYTRNGSFTLTADRQLVTADGMPVLGENGPMTLPDGQIWVDSDGTVRADNTTVDRLQLISFDPASDVASEGFARYTFSDAGAPSVTAGVSQGFLEQSNVDLDQAMVDSLAASRSYSMAQQMLKMSDDTLGLAVNEVGRVT